MTTRDIKMRILANYKDLLGIDQLSILAQQLDTLSNASRYELSTDAREVIDWEEIHHGKWWDKPESHWLASLMEEVLELALALEGKHEHTPELELKQIGSIAIGWLRMRRANK